MGSHRESVNYRIWKQPKLYLQHDLSAEYMTVISNYLTDISTSTSNRHFKSDVSKTELLICHSPYLNPNLFLSLSGFPIALTIPPCTQLLQPKTQVLSQSCFICIPTHYPPFWNNAKMHHFIHKHFSIYLKKIRTHF